MFKLSSKGGFPNFEKFVRNTHGDQKYQRISELARLGADTLASQTPSLSGVTAASWDYEIELSRDGCVIHWTNNNIQQGFSVAIGLQYGHGTGTGGWVSGQDYINPAMKPIFDKILDDVWKVVTNA